MEVYVTNVDAKNNSIAAQNPNDNGAPAKVTFSSVLLPGDVLEIQVPVYQPWQSVQESKTFQTTNAAGVPVQIEDETGAATLNWAGAITGIPAEDLVKNYPKAAKHNFTIGCLVGSLDDGQTFFPIGTDFMTTVGKNLPPFPESLSSGHLLLFFWDINCDDNTGTIFATVMVDRAEPQPT